MVQDNVVELRGREAGEHLLTELLLAGVKKRIYQAVSTTCGLWAVSWCRDGSGAVIPANGLGQDWGGPHPRRSKPEAAKSQPRENGKIAGPSTTSGQTSAPRGQGSAAKAASPGTNRGAVERMDTLLEDQRGLAEKVQTGEIDARLSYFVRASVAFCMSTESAAFCLSTESYPFCISPSVTASVAF
jgi:hypothetical protein